MRRLIAAVFVVTVAATGCSQPSAPSPESSRAATQSVLPFADLDHPYDVSTDAAGNVYVSDIDGGRNGSNKVIELPAGAKTQRQVPYSRATVLADPSGAVWVIDGGQSSSRFLKLAPDGGRQAVLPLPGLDMHGRIDAVDNAGNVYGMDGGGQIAGGGCCLPIHVVTQASGSNTVEVLPFQPIEIPAGMATDAAGNLYVGDGSRSRVLKWVPGMSGPVELPFGVLRSVIDVAVDAEGAVYAIDGQQNQVLKLAPNAAAPVVLAFQGLLRPVSVAVHGGADVFVVDAGHKRVVELKGA